MPENREHQDPLNLEAGLQKKFEQAESPVVEHSFIALGKQEEDDALSGKKIVVERTDKGFSTGQELELLGDRYVLKAIVNKVEVSKVDPQKVKLTLKNLETVEDRNATKSAEMKKLR